MTRTMEILKSAINWFEIPATDFERAVRFYSEIYAFEMQTRGTIVVGKKQIAPEIGYFATIVDTEGNRIYLHSMN